MSKEDQLRRVLDSGIVAVVRSPDSEQLVEVGEIPVSDGPGLWRPAQPARDPQEIKALAEVR